MIMAADGAAEGRTADDDTLEALRWDWGEAYLIGHDDERGWWAARRDRIGSLLTGADPDALRGQIRADYALKRVPRDLPGAGDGQ
jgi:hypothetical protein